MNRIKREDVQYYIDIVNIYLNADIYLTHDIAGYMLQSRRGHNYVYGRTLREIYDMLRVFTSIYEDFKIERNDK